MEDLIAFLRRDMVGVRAYEQGFLHAKSYIFYGDLPVGGADRFQPVAAIVGSSNFTGPGLTTNKELNLSHKTALTEEEMARIGPPPVDGREEMELRRELMSGVGAQAITELDRWFRERWEESGTSRKSSSSSWTRPSSARWSTPLPGVHEGPLRVLQGRPGD